MIEDIQSGIVNFVNSTKAALPESANLSFENFQLKLIGEQNIKTITPEGLDLLKTTHSLIVKGSNSEEIKEVGAKTFAKAMTKVLEYEKNAHSGSSLENGSVYLFGGNKESLLGYESETMSRAAPDDKCGSHRDCHWYQLGCHAHNVGVWICKHKDLLAGISYILAILYYAFTLAH